MSGSQACPSASEIGIELDRSLEHLPSKLDVLASPLLEQLPPTEIKFVRLHVAGRGREQPALVPRRERETQAGNDAVSDLVLDRKDVFEFSVEAFRPQVITMSGVDELDDNAHTISRLADATFKERLHTESLSNYACIHVGPPECKTGCPRRDVKATHLGECVQNFLSYTVTKVFLVALGAEIRKWQYRDRANRLFSFLWRLLCLCDAMGHRLRRVLLQGYYI